MSFNPFEILSDVTENQTIEEIEMKLHQMELESFHKTKKESDIYEDVDDDFWDEDEEQEEENEKEDEYYIQIINEKTSLDLLDVIFAAKSCDESCITDIISKEIIHVMGIEIEHIKALIDIAIRCVKRKYNTENMPHDTYINEVVFYINEACKNTDNYLYQTLMFVDIEKEAHILYECLRQNFFHEHSVEIVQFVKDELYLAESFNIEENLKKGMSYQHIKYSILKRDVSRYIRKKEEENTRFLEKDNTEIYKTFLSENSPKVIAKKLDEYVYGNGEAKKSLAISVYQHIKTCAYRSNVKAPVILITGPVGMGKSEFGRALKHILKETTKVSFRDAGALSPNGYKGSSCYELLSGLNKKGLLKNGIVILDEFDKIIKPEFSSDGDNSNIDIQNDLLKILEGESVTCQTSVIEPQNTMFILIGSFDWMKNTSVRAQIGFNSQNKCTEDEFDRALINNGMIPELRRRIDKIIHIDDLTQIDFEHIFRSNLESGIFAACRRECELDSINLTYDDDIVPLLAQYGYQKQLGVSGMNSIFKEAFEMEMYEAVGSCNQINITRKSIESILDKRMNINRNRRERGVCS